MSGPVRILFTASRKLDPANPADRETVVLALSDTCALVQRGRPAVLVHGDSRDKSGERCGGDLIADQVWTDWVGSWPDLFLPAERHPAAERSDPKARNLAMVNQGADRCAAVADSYASGTGHCARAARRAGIPTQDFGVPTDRRPEPPPQLDLGATPAEPATAKGNR